MYEETWPMHIAIASEATVPIVRRARRLTDRPF
jgi:hypothetical protein